MGEPGISRREFLKLSGLGLAALVIPKSELGENDGGLNKLIFDETRYLASTNEQATVVARQIDFVDSEVESPSNMCGPLAASIMKESQFYPRDFIISPRKFWLADPDRLHKLLPENLFAHIYTPESVRSFDFSHKPLNTGDFLFLHGGSFGHMIVVSEIDRQGKAYAISNVLQKDDQFTVEKVLLYDPADPSNGFFRNEWVRPGSVHGKTGVTFDVWRLKQEYIDTNYGRFIRRSDSRPPPR